MHSTEQLLHLTLPKEYEMPYQEAYALVFYAHGMTKEEHESLQEYIAHLRNMTNGFTSYTADIDPKYSDEVVPLEA